MSLDFSKVKPGDVVRVHCCYQCFSSATGRVPEGPAESGKESLLCDVCGHYGIGSKAECTVDDWLMLHVRAPRQPDRATPVDIYWEFQADREPVKLANPIRCY